MCSTFFLCAFHMLEENWKNSEFYHCFQSWIIFLDCESYYICLLSQDKQKNFHIPWAQRTLHQWVFDVFSMKLENQLTARLYHINQVYLKWGIYSHFSRKEKYIASLHTPVLTRPLSIVTSGIPSTSSTTFTVFFNMLFPGVAYSSEVPEGFQPHSLQRFFWEGSTKAHSFQGKSIQTSSVTAFTVRLPHLPELPRQQSPQCSTWTNFSHVYSLI